MIKINLKKLSKLSLNEIDTAVLDKKYVENLTDEDLQLLKNVTKSDLKKEKDYDILLKSGFIPIIIKRKSSSLDDMEEMTAELGRGAYGVAYEATRIGTNARYAVKLTEDEKEVEVRRKIEALREKLPESIKAHLVQVFDIKEIQVPVESAGIIQKAFQPGATKLQRQQPASADQKIIYKTKYIIQMQLVRSMNPFEKEVLYGGIGSLDRMIKDFKLNYYLTDPILFLELSRDRLQKFKAYRVSAAFVNFIPYEKDKGEEQQALAQELGEKLIDQALEQLRTNKKALDDWTKNISSLLKSDPTNPYFNYSDAAGEYYKAIFNEIGRKYGKDYLKYINKSYTNINSSTVGDFLYSNIINLEDGLLSGIRNEIKEYLNLRLGKKDEKDFKFKHVSSFATFAKKLGLLKGTSLESSLDVIESEPGIKKAVAEKYKEISKELPEKVKSFMDAIMSLAINYNIYWRDLHSGNVMVDPKSGEYLAVDIGLFEIGEADTKIDNRTLVKTAK